MFPILKGESTIVFKMIIFRLLGNISPAELESLLKGEDKVVVKLSCGIIQARALIRLYGNKFCKYNN